MKSRPLRFTLLFVATALFGCDHATKLAAVKELEGRAPVSLVPGYLDLRMTHNDDVAFSLFRRFDLSHHPLALALLASIVLAFVSALWWRRRTVASRIEHLGYATVIAGALGNLADRLFRGYVVDFIHLRAWPVFNVADIAVVVGALLIGLSGLRGGGRHERSAGPRLPPTPGAA